MKIFKALSRSIFCKFKFASRCRAIDVAAPDPLQQLSREDVLNCYRILLGRAPENEDVVQQALLHHSNFQELRLAFLKSAEFRTQIRPLEYDNLVPTYLMRTRPTVAFIHLLKTGGTTLHSLLQQHFSPDRICPVRDSRLDVYGAIELSQFDFFSGHFDWFSVGLIPRDHIRKVTLFREPQARLISFYRFLKSHPVGWEHENNLFVTLVHRLTIEEFFEHPFVRSSPEICNHYLVVFGLAYSQSSNSFTPNQLYKGRDVLAQAISRVHSLDAIGIFERFDQSINLVFQSLNLPVPGSIPRLQVTDSQNSAVELVTVTPRLAEAFRDLIVHDKVIYGAALDEFERRSETGI